MEGSSADLLRRIAVMQPEGHADCTRSPGPMYRSLMVWLAGAVALWIVCWVLAVQ